MINLMNDISFKTEDGKLVKMFDGIAKEVADKLKNDYIIKFNKKAQKDIKKDTETKPTQFRQFYEKILELNNKAEGLNDIDFKIKILPFVKMLNSKVQYSHSRENSGKNFVILMEKSIKAVNSKEELQNFKYFLEAIIGYMPKK